jgi:adenylate kinase
MTESFKDKEAVQQCPNIVLFGPPGAGKGEQGCRLAEEYGYVILGTGDLFRKNLENKTPLGIEAKGYMDKGELVPDELVILMVEEHLETIPEGAPLIFDGFPRTENQRKLFNEFMEKRGEEFEVVALTAYSAEEVDKLIGRLLGRGKTSGRSDDQNENTILTRISNYEKQTGPLLNNWEQEGQYVHKHSAIGKIEDIQEWIQGIVKEYSKRVEDVLSEDTAKEETKS